MAGSKRSSSSWVSENIVTVLKSAGGLLAVGAVLFACNPGNFDAGNKITASRYADIRAQEVESAVRLMMEGHAGYQAEAAPKDGYAYCRDAVALANVGEFRLSIRAAAKALYLGELEHNEDLLAQAKRDLANAYFLAGAADRAVLLARESIQHASRLNSTGALTYGAQAQKILADSLVSLGHIDEALPIYEKLLDGGATPNQQRTLLMAALANAYLEKGQTRKANELFTQASRMPQGPYRTLALRGLGKVALAENRYADAIRLYDEAEQQATGAGQEYFRLLASAGSAQARYRSGDQAAALATYLRVISGADQLAERFRSEEFRAGFYGTVSKIFDEAVIALAKAGQAEKAFEVSERGRARALNDLVQGRIDLSQNNVAIPKSTARARTLAEIRSALPPATALLAYHTTPNGIVAWLIRKSELTSQVIPWSRADVDEIRAFRQSLRNRRPGWQTYSDALGAKLLGFAKLEPNEALIIVPHGPLHYIPFEALRIGGTELAEPRAISYSPSASIYAEIVKRSRVERDQVLGLGDPDIGRADAALPGARREVELLRTVYPRANILVSKNASKAAFLTSAPSSNIIHVAAHADVDEIDPLYSTIFLADTPGVSGRLEAHEIYRLALDRRSLVTLSACDTGLGRIGRGDEQYGFVRTFLGAGADTIIVSLWPVSDTATEKLMSIFYRQLRSHSPRDALHIAQTELKREEGFRHPYFWAAFQLVGDSR